MLSFLNKYGRNLFYSQNGEEGIIIQCVRRFADHGVLQSDSMGHGVEIGGHDGKFCSNTALLIDSHWSGLFVEADYNLHLQSKKNWAGNPKVRHQCSKVDGNNINAFVKDDCDLLSLDTDGLDYELFAGLKAKPKIIIIEIDSSIQPGTLLRDDGLGCTYENTVRIGIDKGYFLLCHTGNLVFIPSEYRDLFPEVIGDGLSNSELYFNRSWVKEEVAA